MICFVSRVSALNPLSKSRPLSNSVRPNSAQIWSEQKQKQKIPHMRGLKFETGVCVLKYRKTKQNCVQASRASEFAYTLPTTTTFFCKESVGTQRDNRGQRNICWKQRNWSCHFSFRESRESRWWHQACQKFRVSEHPITYLRSM